MLVKNKEVKIEYGCYGNYTTVKPLRIVDKRNTRTGVEVLFTFDNKIDTIYSENRDIDFNSFE